MILKLNFAVDIYLENVRSTKLGTKSLLKLPGSRQNNFTRYARSAGLLGNLLYTYLIGRDQHTLPQLDIAGIVDQFIIVDIFGIILPGNVTPSLN